MNDKIPRPAHRPTGAPVRERARGRWQMQRYTKADWEKMRGEEEAVNARIVEAMDAAEAARDLIDQVYGCTPAGPGCRTVSRPLCSRDPAWRLTHWRYC